MRGMQREADQNNQDVITALRLPLFSRQGLQAPRRACPDCSLPDGYRRRPTKSLFGLPGCRRGAAASREAEVEAEAVSSVALRQRAIGARPMGRLSVPEQIDKFIANAEKIGASPMGRLSVPVRFLIAALLASLCLTSCGPRTTPYTVAERKLQWTDFSMPEGRFRVKMPDKPMRKISTNLGNGHAFEVRFDNRPAFRITYLDCLFLPKPVETPERKLDVLRAMMMSGFAEPREVSRRDIKLGDMPGQEVEYRAGQTIRARIYISENRHAFVLEVFGNHVDLESSDPATFFDSFELRLVDESMTVVQSIKKSNIPDWRDEADALQAGTMMDQIYDQLKTGNRP
jgi:hypothetical protein